MLNRYKNSQLLLERAEKSIPLGSQTFSKCYTQYPHAASPLFLTHGKAGRVWDVDDNEYVDLVCGLLPVVLGYCDPDVDQAITRQLGKGISFSLATTLEVELAERLIEIIPCAEMVRFGKNGTDATSAAVRLARAYTGRERIMAGGYHGWQDWYIGATTRSKGIPESVRQLTHRVPYNDLDAIEQLFKAHPGEFAAFILEPMNVTNPAEGYLDGLQKLTHEHGALLIFDEVITGFRYALGGAQELFEITPDLASFGKAMGNGMPISAVVGRRDIMMEMEDIFFSSTFGGEALSLAAAIAVIDKMRSAPVIDTLWSRGRQLQEVTTRLIARYGLEKQISLSGKAPWTLLGFQDHPLARKEAIKTLYVREMLANGVLTLGSHNICYAHNEQDIRQVLSVYKTTLSKIRAEIDGGELEQNLDGPVIEPVFKVR